MGSGRNKLQKVGDRTAPWGSPLGRLQVPKVVTYAWRPERKFAYHRLSLFCGVALIISIVSMWQDIVLNALCMCMAVSMVRGGVLRRMKSFSMCCGVGLVW